MAAPNPYRSTIFLHIPKAAGTTLGQIVARQARASETYSLNPTRNRDMVEQFRQMPAEQRAAYRLIQGHMPYGLHEYASAPCAYVTMLRHPVDRVISYYFYAISTPEQYMHRAIKQRQLSLAQFAASGLNRELDNGQTRQMSGFETYTTAVGQCTPGMLEAACQNLRDNVAAVGITERFDDSIVLFRMALGWRLHTLRYTHENVTARDDSRASISADVRRLIAEHNALDMQLYDFARTVFEERIAANRAEFGRHRLAFLSFNRAYRQWHQLRKAGGRWRVRPSPP